MEGRGGRRAATPSWGSGHHPDRLTMVGGRPVAAVVAAEDTGGWLFLGVEGSSFSGGGCGGGIERS